MTNHHVINECSPVKVIYKGDEKVARVLAVDRINDLAIIKSNINPKTSVVSLGGGYFAAGTENLKRLLENLPKKLYYSDTMPSEWEWHNKIIIKL